MKYTKEWGITMNKEISNTMKLMMCGLAIAINMS